MYISTKDWLNYIKRLSAIDNQAAERMQDWIRKNGFSDRKALIDYAYGIATTYGEASGALSAAMYDEIAEMKGKWYPPAVPAPTPEYGEVAKTVNGILKHSEKAETVAGGVSRLVKRTGADTTLLNAERDGAQFAWVPNGDTCAFCLTLASRGWQYMSKKALKNGHAEHIHANCDCTYAIRFSNNDGVAGYDPDKYKRMYNSAEGSTPREKINSMRRELEAGRADARKEYHRDGKPLQQRMDNDKLNSRTISMIESRKHPTGRAASIEIFGDPLNARQERILEKLTKYDERFEFNKRDVSMKDLAALTAHENVEFAMFTRKGKRLIIRGERNSVNILPEDARLLVAQGYRWSGHTHPGRDHYLLTPSPGDRGILKEMNHKYSAIYSSTGRKYIFAVDKKNDIGHKE